MTNKVNYEWCIEHYTDDEFEDIVDNHFSDVLDFRPKHFIANDGEKTRLVLVRNEGNEVDGLQDRYWAYVENNKLPELFTDDRGYPVSIKVPKKFHAEILKYYSNDN